MKTKVNQSEVSQYLKKIDQNSIEYNTLGIMYDFLNRFPYPGFNQEPEYSEKEISTYLEKYKDAFSIENFDIKL